MTSVRAILSTQAVCDYQASHALEELRRASRIHVLLHGYEESGERIARAIVPALPAGAAWIAPNALYPLPRRRKPEDGGGVRLGFSWYFYDPFQDEYFIDPSIAVGFLEALVARLGIQSVPLTLIGFSQGGYLAPFVAERLPNVERVIGIGASFLSEEFAVREGLRMDAIHGALDDRVDPGTARAQHAEALRKGGVGEFSLLPQTAHVIDDAVREKVAALLAR